jgi:hypothetical protein
LAPEQAPISGIESERGCFTVHAVSESVAKGTYLHIRLTHRIRSTQSLWVGLRLTNRAFLSQIKGGLSSTKSDSSSSTTNTSNNTSPKKIPPYVSSPYSPNPLIIFRSPSTPNYLPMLFLGRRRGIWIRPKALAMSWDRRHRVPPVLATNVSGCPCSGRGGAHLLLGCFEEVPGWGALGLWLAKTSHTYSPHPTNRNHTHASQSSHAPWTHSHPI